MPQIQVRSTTGEPLSLINIRLSLGHGTSDEAYDDRFTDLAGNTAWPNPLPSSSGYTLYVNERNVDVDFSVARFWVNSLDHPTEIKGDDVELTGPEKKDIRITLNEIHSPIQRVHIDGDKFRTEDGKEFKWCFGSNFMLHQLLAEGQSIDDFLYDGLNGYRVFGSYHYIAQQVGMKDFDPSWYSNYYESLDNLCTKLEEKGKYIQYNSLCDRQYLPGDLRAMRNMVNETVEVLKSHKNTFFSLGNENFKNGFNADDFDKPEGIISACGSGGSGDPAPLSKGKPWHIQHQHLRRDEKMFIDIPPVDAPTYFMEHKVIFDETLGFADFVDVGKRTNNTDWAFKLGRIMSAYNGGVIHLHSGGHSQPLGKIEEFCKDEFVRGMNDA